MSFTSILFLSLLQIGAGTVPSERIAVPPPAQATTPTISVVQEHAIPVPAANHLRFQNGILEIPKHHRVTVAATERAVLMSLNTEQRDANGNPVMVPVREGMNVVKGQVLGNFDDEELRSILRINRAQLAVAKAERDKVIEKVFAELGVDVAKFELQRMVNANSQHSRVFPGDFIFPAVEVRRQELAVAQAEANLELQQYTIDEVRTREVEVRESEMERTQTQIELRRLIAPINGTIIRIHAAEGEWKREGDPILEIVNLETMWVKVPVDATRYSESDVDGKQATVRVTLANGRTETFQGEVVFCVPMIVPGPTFDIFVEIQNRRVGNHWLLQPGRDRVDIVIPLPGQ